MASQESFNLQKFIISIVIIGVVLVMGIYITDSISDVTKNSDASGISLNESITFGAVNAPQSLDVAGLEDVSCVLSSVTNETTTGGVILLGNFTVTSCTVLNATALSSSIGNGTVYVSYTYYYTDATSASNAAEDVVSALATGTSWISILVVVGFAVIILTMLTSGLGAAASREGGVPYY